jgi:hypothetical protein
MGNKAQIGLVILSMLTGGYAQASDIPTIDYRLLCEKMSKVMVSLTTQAARTGFVVLCEGMEEDAYAKITHKWSQIPDKITDRCLRVRGKYGEFGYSTLNECLDDALQKGGFSQWEYPFYTLSETGRRYWTHGECMEARGDGHGVCHQSITSDLTLRHFFATRASEARPIPFPSLFMVSGTF